MKPVTIKVPVRATAVAVVPTFNLRGVNFLEIYSAYKRGDYHNLVIPETKIKDVNISSLTATVYSNNESQGMYTKTNKDGSIIIRATTDQKAYEVYNKTGSLPESGQCDYCRRVKSNLMICPTSLYIIESEDAKSNTYIAYGPTLQCSFRCALTYAKLYSKVDHLFSKSEEIIKFIFGLMYPDKRLDPAPDYKLLIINGGSVSDEEYDNPKYQYIRVSSVIMAPLKLEYTRTIVN
jgi:hypothetical protein